jgi:hypothetical protein
VRPLSHPPAYPQATALIVGAFLLLGAPLLQAQVAVYKLVLKADDDASVNLAYFERAYLAVDLEEGLGTLFFLANAEGDANAGGKFFIEARDAMQAYTAFDSDETAFLVIRTITKNRTAHSVYVATGRIDLTLDTAEGRPPLKLARKLTGVFTSTDDESELSTAPTDGSLGVCGFGSLVATLERERTEDVNRRAISYDALITSIRESLVEQGFENPNESATGPVTGPTEGQSTASPSSPAP